MSGVIEDKDFGWKEIVGNLAKADGKTTKVGVVGEAAKRKLPSGLIAAEVAAIHEFGAPDAQIPERSFIRAGVDDNRDAIVGEFILLGEAIFDAEPDVLKGMLEHLGGMTAGFIQDEIRRGLEPALSEEVADEHGDWRPLAVWLAEAAGGLQHEEQDKPQEDE